MTGMKSEEFADKMVNDTVFRARYDKIEKNFLAQMDSVSHCIKDYKNSIVGVYLFSVGGMMMPFDDMKILMKEASPMFSQNNLVRNIVEKKNQAELRMKAELENKMTPEQREEQKKRQEMDAKIKIGERFPDAKVKDNAGNMKLLSDYVGKGKYVLIDFWASWCGPCRHEMPNVKAAYEKYASKGFEVISISTDRKLKPWRAAIEELGMNCQMELPDLEGRKAILNVHLKRVKHEEVDIDVVARATAGTSGAELANIVNEAALRAVRMGRNKINTADLEESVETVIAGAQKKGKVVSAEEKRIIAYHEIGHALVAAMQTHSAPVHKITIIPRTSGALGYTMQVESGEQVLMNKDDLFNRIVTLTGGRTAEELICHIVTTGASNDIEQATKLARAMVTRYGMSDKYDMMGLETVNNAYLGGDTSLTCSAETAANIDLEVLDIIKKAHEKARCLIQENIQVMHEAATFLLEKETITGEEFMHILHSVRQEK